MNKERPNRDHQHLLTSDLPARAHRVGRAHAALDDQRQRERVEPHHDVTGDYTEHESDHRYDCNQNRRTERGKKRVASAEEIPNLYPASAQLLERSTIHSAGEIRRDYRRKHRNDKDDEIDQQNRGRVRRSASRRCGDGSHHHKHQDKDSTDGNREDREYRERHQDPRLPLLDEHAPAFADPITNTNLDCTVCHNQGCVRYDGSSNPNVSRYATAAEAIIQGTVTKPPTPQTKK